MYIPTGFETLPDILYRPLLHLQPIQFYECGCHYANKQKYALALKYLDWVSEPINNPDHLPVKKEMVKDYMVKSLKKMIEICCKVWMFDKARQDLKILRDLTGKPFRKLGNKIEDAYFLAANLTLEQPSKARIYQQMAPQPSKVTSDTPCQMIAQSTASPRSESGSEEKKEVNLCVDNLDDYYEEGDIMEGNIQEDEED